MKDTLITEEYLNHASHGNLMEKLKQLKTKQIEIHNAQQKVINELVMRLGQPKDA
jgi:uncharacterized membrane protein (DUF106 family)